ncbi:hypothetical protein ROZALSC1DRAFT_21767, partial [Rozella allomycis CSF55]
MASERRVWETDGLAELDQWYETPFLNENGADMGSNSPLSFHESSFESNDSVPMQSIMKSDTVIVQKNNLMSENSVDVKHKNQSLPWQGSELHDMFAGLPLERLFEKHERNTNDDKSSCMGNKNNVNESVDKVKRYCESSIVFETKDKENIVYETEDKGNIVFKSKDEESIVFESKDEE